MSVNLAALPGLVEWVTATQALADGADVPSMPQAPGSTTGPLTRGGSSFATYRPAGFSQGGPGQFHAFTGGGAGGPAYVAGNAAILNGAAAVTLAGTFQLSADTAADTADMTLAGKELGVKVAVTSLKPRALISTNGTSWAAVGAGSASLSKGAGHYYVLLFGGGSYSLRIDGTQVATGSVSGTIGTRTQDYIVGGASPSGAYPYQGLVGDQAVFASRLAGQDLADLETYLVQSLAGAPVVRAGTPTAAWKVTATPTGRTVRRGSTTAPWTVTAPATGSRRTAGTATSAAWASTGTATGTAPRAGTPVTSTTGGYGIGYGDSYGTAGWTWTVTAAPAGTRAPRGASTAAWSVTAAPTGARTSTATAAASWSVTAAPTSRTIRRGAVSAAWRVLAAPTGASTHRGAATPATTWTAAPTGATRHTGAATARWSTTATADGVRRPTGASTATWGTTAAPTGRTARSGAAAATTGWSAAPAGHAPVVGVHYGSPTDTAWTTTATATGRTTRRGEPSPTWRTAAAATGRTSHAGTPAARTAWAAAPAGSTPGLDVAAGTPAARWGVTAAAAGRKLASGRAVAAWSTQAAPRGRQQPRGAVSAAWASTATPAGRRAPHGAPTAAWSVTAAPAGGAGTRRGDTTAAWAFTATHPRPVTGRDITVTWGPATARVLLATAPTARTLGTGPTRARTLTVQHIE